MIDNIHTMSGKKKKDITIHEGHVVVTQGVKKKRLDLIIAESLPKPSPDKNVLVHLNGNNFDMRRDNLKWMTRREAMEHKKNLKVIPNINEILEL